MNENMVANKKEAFWESHRGFLFVVAIVVGIWVGWLWAAPFLSIYFFPGEGSSSATASVATSGQFGDMYGGLTSLFTALAFAAVWWTGRMQRADLSLQRQELAETRSVMATQRLETTLFNTLNLLRSLENEVKDGEVTGGAVFAYFYKNIRHSVYKNNGDAYYGGNVKQFERKHWEDEFRRIYEGNNELILGPYFRTLYGILTLIENNAKDEKAVIFYGNLVRSQLDSGVLCLLAVNGLCEDISGTMKDRIIKYRLLKYIPKGDDRELLSAFYPRESFLGRDDE